MNVVVLVLLLIGTLCCFAAALPALDSRVGHAGAGLIGVAVLLATLGAGV